MIEYSILFEIGVLISAISQVLLKKAAQKTYLTLYNQYLNFKVILAYILFFISTLITVYSYKKIPLSFGGLLDAMGYIYVTLFGILIFKEKLNLKRICSLILIVFGIIIYSIP